MMKDLIIFVYILQNFEVAIVEYFLCNLIFKSNGKSDSNINTIQ